VPFIVLADDNGRVAERVRLAGRIRPEHALEAGAWRVFAAGAEEIARAVREETGLRTVFHHHGGGWIETAAEVRTLMEATRPDLLGLCLDTGHYALGQGDPLAALAEYGDRIWHIHLKDFAPSVLAEVEREGLDYFGAVARGVFCELGRGSVPFAALVAELRRRGHQGWLVVEQDVLPGLGTPLASARRNREFLSGLGL
jgi:inosose dehydratase